MSNFTSSLSGRMENEVLEMVAMDLPEEVIREIVLRLPVKSLLKFKCVSKSWLSLISSHQFAMAHLNNNACVHDRLIFGTTDFFTRNVHNLYSCSISSVSELTTGVVYSVDHENPVFDCVQLDCPYTGIPGSPECKWLVGSCNGLVCLSFGADIILWNPTINKFKKLPYSGTHFNGFRYGNSLAFGYDNVHDDYKVSVYFNPQLKVYSRRSNSWKVLGNWPDVDACHWPGHFLNGAILWSVQDVRRSPDWFIVAQDVVSDEFVELPLPNFEDNDVVVVKVDILDGCVALCCGYNTHMDVWLMKEYGVGESWIKQLCLPFFQALDRYFILPLHPGPLLFFGDGRILIKYGTTLRIFDPTNPQPQQLSGLNLVCEEVTVTTYFESLVSPNLDEDA